MKIMIDRDLELTRGDYAGNLARGVEPDIKVQIDDKAEITHTPVDLFRRHGFPVEADPANNLGEADRQYHELRDLILQNEEIKKQGDQKFLAALQHGNADFDRLLLEKVTYQLDIGEDVDRIAEELRKMESNAVFRAISIDRENNRITTYATREGIWDIDGSYTAKSAELRSAGKIRTDRALRSVKDPTRKVDTKRLNYPLFEETKALVESGAIEYSAATREQPDGEWRDDTPVVYVTKLHFKDDLTEEDFKDQAIAHQAAEQIKQETTHVGKRQATKEQAAESIEENKKEIHTKHEPVQVVKKADEAIQSERENALMSYADRLVAEMEERQKREREELKQKLAAAMGEERNKAKQTLLSSLANGMTIDEAIDNLRAAKHNDILIQAVLEDLKTDMLLSVKKDEIIAEKSKELDQTSKELERSKKSLEAEAKANKTNHENYIKELNKRKEAEVAIGKLKTITEKLNEHLRAAKSDIRDLKEEIREKDRELEEKDRELDAQYEEIHQKDKVIDKLHAELEDKDGRIAALESKAEEDKVLIAELNARLTLIEEIMDEKFKNFDEKLSMIKKENDHLKKEVKRESLSEKIAALKGDKEEDGAAKKHSDDLFDQE